MKHFREHFTDEDLDNLHIEKIQAVIQPQLLMEEVPVTAAAKETVLAARKEMKRIINGESDKLSLIVGPCSIHDPDAALDYARRLKAEADRTADDVLVLMRVYFEKPRTTVGWKGLINDPDLDETFKINKGLRIARKLLADINEIGVPVACEFLDTLVPQYIADLVTWGAIGARTTESQLHRELASGLSMPVGFKNGTDGNVQIAIDACRAASAKQRFLGITKQGIPAIVHAMGNPHVHIILRGGAAGPNYDAASVADATSKLEKAKVNPRLCVDVSHGNSRKDHKNQPSVFRDLCGQISGGNKNIVAMMVESNLMEGRQEIPKIPTDASPAYVGGASSSDTQNKEVVSKLRWGVSVTDACIAWETTVELIDGLVEAVRQRRGVGA